MDINLNFDVSFINNSSNNTTISDKRIQELAISIETNFLSFLSLIGSFYIIISSCCYNMRGKLSNRMVFYVGLSDFLLVTYYL
jgi:hypothetical protein